MPKRLPYPLITSLLLCFFFMFACQQEAKVPATETGESATEIPASPASPTEVNTPEAQASNGCIECHSDKQLLIDTAKPEEVVIAENEGEG